MNNQLDYQDRAIAMNKKAMSAEIKKIETVYDRFTERTKAIEKNTIGAVNDAREIGLHLQTMCGGHEQMELAFWNQHCKGKLGFKFDAAKMFIGLARRIPAPVKTLEEAVPHVQEVLVAQGLLELPERSGPQKRSTVTVMERFFKEITIIRGGFKNALRERPMEQWEPDAIDTFISETEWLAKERERALKLKGQPVIEQ